MTPILFIHGFPFDSTMWENQRTEGFATFAPDLPGFGTSVLPAPANPSIEAYADFILHILRAQKIRPIVAGLSMGGYILLSLLRTHPEAIAAAILIDTRADSDSLEVRANRLKAIDDVRQRGTSNLINTMLPRLLATTASPEVVEQTRRIMQRQSPTAVIAAQTAMANRRDQTDLLATLKIPTLIIVGEHDIVTPPAVARRMHAAVPGSKLVEIPGAGHMSPLENPQAVNAALREFVSSLSEISDAIMRTAGVNPPGTPAPVRPVGLP